MHSIGRPGFVRYEVVDAGPAAVTADEASRILTGAAAQFAISGPAATWRGRPLERHSFVPGTFDPQLGPPGSWCAYWRDKAGANDASDQCRRPPADPIHTTTTTTAADELGRLDLAGLQRELEDLETTDPDVREASARVDAAAADIVRRRRSAQRVLLAAIDHALRTGSQMTGANLAFDMLCEQLGVDRDRLESGRRPL